MLILVSFERTKFLISSTAVHDLGDTPVKGRGSQLVIFHGHLGNRLCAFQSLYLYVPTLMVQISCHNGNNYINLAMGFSAFSNLVSQQD